MCLQLCYATSVPHSPQPSREDAFQRLAAGEAQAGRAGKAGLLAAFLSGG
jgi:hypothetical protein